MTNNSTVHLLPVPTTRNSGEGEWIRETPIRLVRADDPRNTITPPTTPVPAPGIYYRCVCGAITPGIPRWCPVCEHPLEADVRGEIRYAQNTDPMYFAARITELERLVRALIDDRNPFSLHCADCGIDCMAEGYSQYLPGGVNATYCRLCYVKRGYMHG